MNSCFYFREKQTQLASTALQRLRLAGRLVVAGAACLLLGLAVPGLAADQSQKPNIIFILADDECATYHTLV